MGLRRTSLRMSPERGYASPGCTAVKSSRQAQGPTWPGLGETDPSERTEQLLDELSQGRQGRGPSRTGPGPRVWGRPASATTGSSQGFFQPPFWFVLAWFSTVAGIETRGSVSCHCCNNYRKPNGLKQHKFNTLKF